jgi:TonB-dependent starch-binding outer membrane protein SusC
LELQRNFGNVDRTIGNIQLDYKLHFLPDLHVKANIGLDDAFGFTSNSTDSTAAFAYQIKGSRSFFNQAKKNRIADLSLFYTKDLSSINSKIDVLLLHSYQTFATKNYNFASSSQDGSILPNSTPDFATSRYENRIESYLGQLNYSLSDKYFITGSIFSRKQSWLFPRRSSSLEIKE